MARAWYKTANGFWPKILPCMPLFFALNFGYTVVSFCCTMCFRSSLFLSKNFSRTCEPLGNVVVYGGKSPEVSLHFEGPHAHVWDISYQVSKWNCRQTSRESCVEAFFSSRSALFWDILRLKMVIGHQHFGTTYRFHLQISKTLSSWISWPLKMGPIGCPETSVWNCHSMLCNSPEECRPHVHRGGSTKSLIYCRSTEMYTCWTRLGRCSCVGIYSAAPWNGGQIHHHGCSILSSFLWSCENKSKTVHLFFVSVMRTILFYFYCECCCTHIVTFLHI